MEAEANDTLSVRTTLVNVNYTLQEIQEQLVSSPCLSFFPYLIFKNHFLTAGLPPGKHYSTADNHTKHLCESEIKLGPISSPSCGSSLHVNYMQVWARQALRELDAVLNRTRDVIARVS